MKVKVKGSGKEQNERRTKGKKNKRWKRKGEESPDAANFA